MRTAALLGLIALARSGCGMSAFARLPVSQSGAVDPCLGQREWNANTAAASLADVDTKNGWSPATCRATLIDMACMTKAAPDEIGFRYNAGVVLERCGEPYQAEAVFRSVLDREPTFYRARVSAAVLRFQREGEAALDGAIEELSRAVWDSNDENAEGLVQLAHLELARGSSGDFERAKTHLERAIVLGDSAAVIYVDLARTYMARESPDLAARVIESAIELHPRSSALHNMEGVIAAARRDGRAAAKAFDEASALDSKSFDAAMNRAALDLDLRDFRRGEHDYRVALDLRPDDYDARVGLALSLEGQTSAPARETAVEQLGVAKQLAPRRVEAPALLRELSTAAP